ncbi:P-loop containing nucleoside triphosphate hydrolase protein [Tuber brumale]|nr:P-loop containing nucleoside triphosphate hydrolase protein [Tuber brumale]
MAVHVVNFHHACIFHKKSSSRTHYASRLVNGHSGYSPSSLHYCIPRQYRDRWVDISKIGLQDLRSKLAIIPQDPTLFRGTVQSNLDPFGKHTDEELWGLRQANLSQDIPADGAMASGRITLDGAVEEEGMNSSSGERQLIALARALVQRSRVIVCDEATSSVDIETDMKIQEAITKAFKGWTLLWIAHRLYLYPYFDDIPPLLLSSITWVTNGHTQLSSNTTGYA